MSKPTFPWLHKLTPQQRSDMLDKDFAKQSQLAEDDEAAEDRTHDLDDLDEEDYGPLNRF
jgi:hypothetical protein